MSRQSQFWSYGHFLADHKKCRDNSFGRPVRKWCRTYLVGTDIEIRMTPPYWRHSEPDKVPLCRIHPDNTITFIASVEEVLRNSQSLSFSLHRLIRFSLTRWKKGVYRIGGTEVAARITNEAEVRGAGYSTRQPHRIRGYRAGWQWLANEAPQYFQGIRFDMNTGECLNAIPDTVREVIPEMRTEWLRCLRRYKRGLKARAKIGALSGYAESTMTARAGRYMSMRFSVGYQIWDVEFLHDLLECMKSETYPEHILTAFVKSAPSKWKATEITPVDIMDAVDKTFNTHSKALREQYGVFGEVLHKKE